MQYEMKNKIVYLSYANNFNSSWGFSLPKSNSSINIEEAKNKTAIWINPTYYSTHKLYINDEISKYMNMRNPHTIVINDNDFILPAMLSTTHNTNLKQYYFTKNVSINKENVKFCNLENSQTKYIFENTVPVQVADILSKSNISFETMQKYGKITAKGIQANTALYSFSDYYHATSLHLKDLSDTAIFSLNDLFAVNKKLSHIYFDDTKIHFHTIENVLQSYLTNRSKYSKAKFVVQLNSLNVSYNEIKKLYQINHILEKNHTELHINLYQSETTSFMDFMNTIKPLRKFATKINQLKLSPLEKLILVYDEAKNKMYVDNKQNKKLSRNLLSSLKSDYVVCHAFAYRLKALCDMTHIPATIAKSRLKSSKTFISEHSKVITYLKDSKYGFKDILILEPTFDNIELDKLGGEQDLDNYLYFLNDFSSSKKVYHMKQNEYGLLQIAEQKGIIEDQTEHNIEAERQINDLYGTNLNAYHQDILNNTFLQKVNQCLYTMKQSSPIEIDVFISALYHARSAVDDSFNIDDINRIIEVNRFKGEGIYNKHSKNMFYLVEMEEESSILDDSDLD